MIYLTNINLNGNELQNAVVQPLAVAPSNPKYGQIYYDSTTSKLRQYDGTSWQTVGVVVSQSSTNGNIVVDGKEMSVYELPKASKNSLGGIIAGSGLLIDSEGRISVDLSDSLKSYYNKDEVDSLLSTLSSLEFKVVQELPTEDISSSTIYLKVREDTSESNLYDEYIYAEDKWELLGNTSIDLTGYVKTSDIHVVATTGNYEDLNNRILRLSTTLSSGNTEAAISIEDSIVHSIESFDTVTGERVFVDANRSGSELYFNISEPYENDISISVLISLL